MELKKRKAESKLVAIRAIKGVHPMEKDTGETSILLMYVDNKYDPQNATCTAGVMRVVENKLTSKSKGVPITRIPNVRMLLERKGTEVVALHVVPVVDALYLTSRKTAEGEPLSEEYQLKIDTDTGSIFVEEAPGTSTQKEVEALVRAIASVDSLSTNDTVADAWLVSFVKGNKCTVMHI